MPYSLNNIPNYISNIPIGAQKLFIAAFNSAYKNNGGNEEKSRIAGWSNVKRKYKKQNGKWIKKTLSVELFGHIKKYSDLTDDVLELPGNLSKVWKHLYNHYINNDDPVIIARKKSWSIIKKYIYMDKIGNWKFKKKCIPEKILMKEIGGIKELKPILRFYKKNNTDRALFKMIVPIEGIEVIDGIHYLKGVASANIIDRQNDIVEKSFIDKMNSIAKGLNVFVDHKTDTDHLIGNINEVLQNDDNLFIPITKLEKPEENDHVSRLIKRLKNGIKLGYSIGGYVNKAVKLYHEEINDYVRHLIDGEIYELSVVPVPALPCSEISLTTKGLGDNNFESILDGDLDDDYIKFMKTNNVQNIEMEISDTDSRFWMFFEKAADFFSKNFKEQKSFNDLCDDDFDEKCFIISKNGNKYPVKIIDGKKRILHIGLLDKSFSESFANGDKDIINQIDNIRKTIGIKDKDVKIIDFKKLLVSTLSDVVDARQARFKLYDIVDEFHWAIDSIVYSDMDENEKIKDITELGNQLSQEIRDLSQAMSRETLISFY